MDNVEECDFADQAWGPQVEDAQAVATAAEAVAEQMYITWLIISKKPDQEATTAFAAAEDSEESGTIQLLMMMMRLAAATIGRPNPNQVWTHDHDHDDGYNMLLTTLNDLLKNANAHYFWAYWRRLQII